MTNTATPDHRHPLGRFAPSASATDASRATALKAIAELPANLRRAVAGLSDAQLDTPYRPDGWTIRQVVHHLADSHLNAYARIRLALTEENPAIKAYDEKLWAELPDAKSDPIEPSLQMIDGLHTRWIALASTLKPNDFTRTLQHPERGPISVDFLTELYAWHGRHHVAHITELRKRSSW